MMNEREITDWLAADLPRFETLTSAVSSMIESLLRSKGVDYLSVTGRTKSLDGVREKIHRKRYQKPKEELTDISGIRVILYFESDVQRASQIVEESFDVDHQNSLNKSSMLSIDQIGYRSTHYVCDLGKARCKLPEYSHLANLRFEVQLRTVLQHAWAELAHDRNYKFSGKLPREVERELFLYAGLLEVADRGFDELSTKIDAYAKEMQSKTSAGDFDIEINSVSLQNFVQSWASQINFKLSSPAEKFDTAELVEELKNYGLVSIDDLRKIIPEKYGEVAKQFGIRSNIFGLVRDWMLMHDYKRYRDQAWKMRWKGIRDFSDDFDERKLFQRIVGEEVTKDIFATFDY